MIQQRIPDDGDATSDQLRQRIALERTRLGQTIDAIGTELKPENLISGYVDETTEALYDYTIEKGKEITSQAVNVARRKPAQTLLLIAGITLLIGSLSKTKSENK